MTRTSYSSVKCTWYPFLYTCTVMMALLYIIVYHNCGGFLSSWWSYLRQTSLSLSNVQSTDIISQCIHLHRIKHQDTFKKTCSSWGHCSEITLVCDIMLGRFTNWETVLGTDSKGEMLSKVSGKYVSKVMIFKLLRFANSCGVPVNLLNRLYAF